MTKNDSYPLNIREFKSDAIFMQDNKIGLSQIVPRVFNNMAAQYFAQDKAVEIIVKSSC